MAAPKGNKFAKGNKGGGRESAYQELATTALLAHHIIMEIIIGAAVSLFIQWLKQEFSSEWTTLAVLLATSLAAAGVYTVLADAGYWQVVATVLVTAGAFYTFVIQRFESEPAPAVNGTVPLDLQGSNGL